MTEERRPALRFAEENEIQDVFYFNHDDEVVQNALADMATYDENNDELGVNVALGYKAAPILFNVKKEYENIELPSWVDQWKSESSWARSTAYSSDTNLRLVWSVDEMLVFQSPFILSVNDRLRAMNADVTWSDQIGGWVFPWFDEDMLEELQDIVYYYDFLPSSAASTLLNGTLDSELVIDDTIIDAEEMGYSIPTAFDTHRTLKEHQKRGVLSALTRRRVLLADSPGLGKGGIFISTFLSEFEYNIRDFFADREDIDTENIDISNEEVRDFVDEELCPIVLVCQISMVYPLALEIKQWWSDAKIAIMSGTAPAPVEEQVNFIICPISIVSKRIDDILEAGPKGLIVDECHMLKNPVSERTKAVQELADSINAYSDELIEQDIHDNSIIILASGTPMPNAPHELWSLLCVLGEEQVFVEAALDEMKTDMIDQPYIKDGKKKWKKRPLNDKEVFERRWCKGGFVKQALFNRGINYVWYNYGASNLSELHRLLSETVMIRRKKRDVIQMPAPYERIIPTSLSPQEQEDYEEIKRHFRDYMFSIADEYAEKWNVSTERAIKMLRGKLDFAEPIIKFSKLTRFVSRTKIDKIVDWAERFMEGDPEIITENAENRKKLIIFAHYIETQEALINSERLQKYGMVSILAGSKDVVEVTERFQKDDDCRIIVCYSGAREGHTLTAAYDVLISEPPPVPSQAEQMVCRCYARVSEDFEPHPAYVHYAVTPNTVDVLQLRRMNLKKGISDAVIDGEDMPAMTKKEREQESAEIKEAEAALIMELVMQGDETMRIAT